MPTEPVLFGDSLDAWFGRLDGAGYRIGVRERLLVQSLLARLAAAGELPGTATLEQMLQLARPLLCAQPEQQRQYGVLLRQFLLERDAHKTDRGTTPVATQDPVRHALASSSMRAALLVGLLAALLIVGGLWWTKTKRESPPSEPAQQSRSTIPTREPIARPIYVPLSSLPIDSAVAVTPGWVAPIRIGLAAIGTLSLLGLCWLAWGRWRRQLYLLGTRTDEEVEERLLTDPDPVSVEASAPLTRRVARVLRQRYASHRVGLDVQATLRATIAACGGLSPRYFVVKQTPEYLILIDRRHPSDHCAAYSEALVAALARNGVAVQLYYFEGSPRTGCWRRRVGHGDEERVVGFVSFAELAARHAGHRLLVFAEAQGLVDEADGALHVWANHLNAFPQRAWLTPMPLASWGRAELIADVQGFLVLPVQPEALHTLADWFSSGQLGLEVGADWPLNFPPLLQATAVAWVARRMAPPAATVQELSFQLRTYLGPARFQWLCACAIFPAISPAVTLALGRELTTDPRDLALGLAAIGALPWFRHGFMPAWLRLELITRLETQHETRFRQIIEQRLAAAIEGPGVGLVTVAQRKRRLAAWLRRRRGPARDVVLVDFVQRGPLARLAQQLPDALRRRLFRGGLPAYGVRGGIVALLPIGVLAATAAAPGIWERLVQPASAPSMDSIEMIYTLRGHEGTVLSVAFSPDGRRIVSGGEDGELRLWDAMTGQTLGAQLDSHGGSAVLSVAFNPDGRRIVSGGQDSKVRLWDGMTAVAVGTPLDGGQGAVSSVAFSPDGWRIVSGGTDGTLRLWDATAGQPVGASWRGHQGFVLSVAFSPDGQRIVSGGEDKKLILWEANSGELVDARFRGSLDRITTVAFSPDGRHILSGSTDGTLQLWDATTGQPAGQPVLTDATVAAFSPDGRRIASGDREGTVRLWDVTTGQLAGQPLRADGGRVASVAFSPDGSSIVSGGANGTLRQWGRPLNATVDIVGCSSPQGVTVEARQLSDRLAQAVREGTLPSLSPVAYHPSAWNAPAGLATRRAGLVLSSRAPQSRAIADALTQWLNGQAADERGVQANRWSVAEDSAVSARRYVVNECFDSVPDPKCGNLRFDLTSGTMNGIPPTISQDDVKNAFGCFTGATADGELFNYGGGVFFLNHDFFFYTGRDYLEVRQNFRGDVAPPLIGSESSVVRGSFGEPQLTSSDGNTWFYGRTYGCLRVELQKSVVFELAAHYQRCDDVLAWRLKA